MGAPGLAKRLWDGVLHRQSLGRIVIKFYPPGGQASISLAPSLAALSRLDWHWLYLQHLAESLSIIEEQEAARLLVAARALGEDFVSSSYWPHVIGEKIPTPIAGAAEIIPEQPGGTALAVEVVRRGREMPSVRLEGAAPQARERLASSNLVLLVHLMRGAAHPLEQYEMFKKIALFAEYCERGGRWHDRATLKSGPLHAVVHADIAGIAPPAPQSGRDTAVPRVVAGGPPEGSGPRMDRAVPSSSPQTPPPGRFEPGRRPWNRPGVAISAAVLLWAGLIVGAFFAPPHRLAPLPSPYVAAPPAGHEHNASSPADRAPAAENAPVSPAASEALPATPRAHGGSGDLRRRLLQAQTSAHPETEPDGRPRFRVVSGTLARDIAELRARSLAEQGMDAFVRLMAGDLAQLQYGAYRSWMNAEADAWRLRAQGYTAVIIPW